MQAQIQCNILAEAKEGSLETGYNGKQTPAR